jgi:hypothetical protein
MAPFEAQCIHQQSSTAQGRLAFVITMVCQPASGLTCSRLYSATGFLREVQLVHRTLFIRCISGAILLMHFRH